MTQTITTQSKLQRCLDAKIGKSFRIKSTPDVLSQLLSDKRSENTRVAYQRDVTLFFHWATDTNAAPTPDLVLEFLHLEQGEAIALVLDYKAHLRNKELSESTINRRLASIKSLVQMGRKLGHCCYSLEDIKGDKTTPYRDTTGVPPEAFKKVLGLCGDNSQGRRDYAILRLLWDNALRRNEVVQINVGDFDQNNATASILGKGKGNEKQLIDLAPATVKAILTWLEFHPNPKSNQPLFVALSPAHLGHRLTGESVRRMVDILSQKAGITKQMSPHRVRHSAITTALELTDGNVRKVQKLSRHSKLETLLIYDDRRQKDQQTITNLLADVM